MLIIQWFKLPDGDWVLTTYVAILAVPVSFLTLDRVLHRIIGTIIGAVIALIIIGNVHNIALLSIIYFVFISAYLSFVKIKNYAFRITFVTVVVLVFLEIISPAADPAAASSERILNIFIGGVLALVAASIWIAFRRKKSDLPKEELEGE